MAYLYKHVRGGIDEVFYIGIGSDEGSKYLRAYSKHNRSKYWERIVSKHGYRVEIMLDDLTWEEACEKEKEFIKLYGRKDLKEGTLVNMTDGGEGALGLTIPKETTMRIVEKRSRKVECPHCGKVGSYAMMKRYHYANCKTITKIEKHIGHPISQEAREKIGKSNSKSHLGKELSETTRERMRGPRKSYKIDDCIGAFIVGLYREGKHSIQDIVDITKLSFPTILKFLKDKKVYTKSRAIKECPHCKVRGGGANMSRYHFNNCKSKK